MRVEPIENLSTASVEEITALRVQAARILETLRDGAYPPSCQMPWINEIARCDAELARRAQ